MWEIIGKNTKLYKSYPRIVGETGGKDFVLAHKSADVDVVVTALCRGAFEYQGQKCSAASRAYIPSNLAAQIKKKLVAEIKTMKIGSVEDFTCFINAVIDEKSFDKLEGYIKQVKKDKGAKILVGGKCDKTNGYFIDPTVIEVTDPRYVTMCEELFGPVLTLYVYDESKFDEAIKLVDSTSPYALTGSVIAQDRYAVEMATKKLANSAGNFYINDKPTGAVVGQLGKLRPIGNRPTRGFPGDSGGSRPRAILENFSPVPASRPAALLLLLPSAPPW